MSEPVKQEDEPSALNRLLLSDVTTSWRRTCRACVLIVFLALVPAFAISGGLVAHRILGAG